MESKRGRDGGRGRIQAQHFLTFPLYICYQEMKDKVLSRAMKKESRRICLQVCFF